MSSLLEEAIVDAKALKEAALKNAENTVLEKYSVEVKKALDVLLEQEESPQNNSEELMEFAEDLPFAFQNEELDAPANDDIVEIDLYGLKARLEEEGEDPEESDLNDALDMAATVGQEDADAAVEVGGEEGIASTAGDASLDNLEEDEEVDLNEESLNELVEDIVSEKVSYDGIPRPQGWSSVNSANNSVEQANNDAMAAAAAAHLDEDEEEIEEEVKNETAPDVVSDAELYEAKISEITESHKELEALLIEAKDQLTKLNLENAKLVYQNKALNSTSLNERQKNQIAEAVQSANSVEEASMIYETIQNAVGTTPDQRTRPQTLREAVQRPTSLLINSKKNNTAPRDSKMDRMLRLAGLNK